MDDNDIAYMLTVNKWSELIDDLAEDRKNEIWDEMEAFAERYASHEGAELSKLLPDLKERFKLFAVGMETMLSFIIEMERKEATP